MNWERGQYICILTENLCILIKILLKVIPEFQINNNSNLVQAMVWWQKGNEAFYTQWY